MKDKCRACKNETSQYGFLFKCIDRNCGAVFWHRKILLENLEDDAVFEKQLSLAEIPSVNNDDYFVELIKQQKWRSSKRRFNQSALINSKINIQKTY